jgi:hypothetical protein
MYRHSCTLRRTSNAISKNVAFSHNIADGTSGVVASFKKGAYNIVAAPEEVFSCLGISEAFPGYNIVLTSMRKIATVCSAFILVHSSNSLGKR